MIIIKVDYTEDDRISITCDKPLPNDELGIAATVLFEAAIKFLDHGEFAGQVKYYPMEKDKQYANR